MKTVLFIDKGTDAAWPAFLQLEYLIDGWQRQGLFDVCAWRPAARTVRAAVPSLASILGEEQDWQAVIVCDLRDDEGKLLDGQHFENPFDFVGNGVPGIDPWKTSDASDPVQESPYPLVRLCQMLGGIPEKVNLPDDGAPNDAAAVAANGGTARRETEWEEAPDGDELQRPVTPSMSYPVSDQYYDMAERYRTGLPFPRRILCISPRTYDEELYRTRVRDLEKNGIEAVRETGFWERNDYPPNTRFLVYDWIADAVKSEDDSFHENVLSEADFADPIVDQRAENFKWLCFWTSVLTLLTADFGSTEMKPYRLHRIAPITSSELVRQALSERFSEWAGVHERIESQIEMEKKRLYRAEYEEAGLPELKADIAVRFDVTKDHLSLDSTEVGYYRDQPKPDYEEWEKRERGLRQSLRDLLRCPRRGLRRGVVEFQRKSVFNEDELEYVVLTEDERIDLEEDIVADELSLAKTTGRRAFRFDTHADAFDKQSQEVRGAIERRPHTPERRFVIIGLLVGSVMGFLACLPAMISVSEAGGATTLSSLASLLIPVIGAIAFLVIQRRKLCEAYKAFSDWLVSVAVLLENEAIRLGDRLSLYAKTRKEWAVARRQYNLGKPTKYGSWLGERLAFVDRRMTAVTSAVGEPPIDYDVLMRIRQQPWNTLSQSVAGEELYDAFEPYACERPFNAHLLVERKVAVPFEFVEKVELEPLRIH